MAADCVFALKCLKEKLEIKSIFKPQKQGLPKLYNNSLYFYFRFLIILTAVLAAYMINQLLHSSEVAGKKTYEELAQLSFGIRGKVIASVFIILHCLGGEIIVYPFSGYIK